MDSILGVWSELSDGTRGVIIGAVLTGIGTIFVTTITTLIANRHARKLQLAQFKFESDERKAESLLQLRREVYLQAADALVELTTALGRSISVAEPDETLSKAAHAFGTAIARVQVAGAPETAVKAAALARVANAEGLKLITDRIPLRSRQSDIGIAATSRDTYQRDVDRCLELMKAFNLEASKDQVRWEAIERQMDFAVKQCNDFGEEWTALINAQSEASLKFMRTLPDRLGTIAAASGPLLDSIRLELGNQSGGELLSAEFQKSQRETKDLVENAVQAMGAHLAIGDAQTEQV